MKIAGFGWTRGAARRARCGGVHSARQRCTADAPLDSEAPARAELAPPTAPITTQAELVRPARATAMAAERAGQRAPQAVTPYVAISPYAWPPRQGIRRRADTTAAQWVAATVGSVLLVAALSVAAVFSWRLTLVRQDAGSAWLAILLSAASAVLAALLLYARVRTYVKLVLALTALTLVTGGATMLALAPALRQMNTEELAEYRAFRAFMVLGAF